MADFNFNGTPGLDPVNPIFDADGAPQVMTQGLGFPLRPVSEGVGDIGDNSVVFDTVDSMSNYPSATVGTTAFVTNYSDTVKSGQLFFVAVAEDTATADNGSYIDGSGVQWEQQFGDDINAASFGVGGDSGKDDSPLLASCFSYVSTTRGGGMVRFHGEMYLQSQVELPFGTVLAGDMEYPTGGKVNLSTDEYGSVIWCASDGLLLRRGTSVKGFLIHKIGTEYPQTNAEAAAWTNIGIEGYGGGSSVKDCLIVGFERAIDMGQLQNPGRFQASSVYMDCSNGIRVANSSDTDRINDCHAWPFLSDFPEVDRIGAAYERITCDGAHIDGCFAYGYRYGYRITDCNQTLITNCGNDGSNAGGVTERVGVSLEGDTQNTRIATTRMIGFTSTAIEINTTGTGKGNNTTISDCMLSSGSPLTQVSIVNGNYINIWGNSFADGANGITIQGDSDIELSVDTNTFGIGVTPLNSASGTFTTNTIVWGESNVIDPAAAEDSWVNARNTIPSINSAAALWLRPRSPLINVINTNAITSIYSEPPGRRVTLHFQGNGASMADGPTINLIGGGTRVFSAGDRITLLCTGSVWYEV